MLMTGMICMVLAMIALATPYVIFPTLCWVVARFKKQPSAKQPVVWPTLRVVIPVYNERERVEEKLRNTFELLYPQDRMHVVVCDDGSTDGTAAKLSQLQTRYDFELVRHSTNRGKSSAINTLMRTGESEIVMVTDASAELIPTTALALAEALEPEEVGVAQVPYATSGAQSGGWRMASRLRQWMSQSDALVGAHGACYAVKSRLVQPLAEDTINDDYVLPMMIRAMGKRAVHTDAGHAYEMAHDEAQDRAARWCRITQGNVQMLWRHRRLMAPKYGMLATSLILHKAMKTAGPIWLAMIAIGGLMVMSSSLYAMSGALLGSLWVAVAMLLSRRLTHIVTLGAQAQWAVARGLWRSLRAESVQWSAPSQSFDRPAPVPQSIEILKRALDICAATVGLILGAPIMLVVAALIKLSDGGPVVYRQTRVCRVVDGVEHTFSMMKFRTMRQDAEQKSGPTWAVNNDNRVTPVGRWLRKMRLDELPQLWHVLVGEMSLVGPRPERPFFTEKLKDAIPFYDDRLMSMKPGITGLAQIYCGYDTTVDGVRDKIQYDLLYNVHLYRVSTYLRMECVIVLKTVVVALTGRGAK